MNLTKELKNSKQSLPPLEAAFQKAVIKRLKSIPSLYHFVKEAKAIRGLPDLIICYNGKFIAWELKRSELEAQKLTGRIVLQRYNGSKMIRSGGIFRFVYPENVEECFDELLGIPPVEL